MIRTPGSSALFIEGIRRPQIFMAAAAKALAAGKPIIAIKTGKSQKSRDSARSHTGAVGGRLRRLHRHVRALRHRGVPDRSTTWWR